MNDQPKVESIWRRSRKLMNERSDKVAELMQEYDRNVYLPAMKALQEECKKAGHVKGKFHENGLGWSWYYCNSCGGRFEIEGPNGEKKDE